MRVKVRATKDITISTIFREGEPVVITEKIHGTWCCIGYHPDIPHAIVTSKGMSAQGLAFKMNEENAKNLYVRALEGTRDENGDTLYDRMVRYFTGQVPMPLYIIGEVFGQGVQDLHYGSGTPQFRAFDVYHGPLDPGSNHYLDDSAKDAFLDVFKIERVPVLYRGPYSRQVVDDLTNGKETVSGSEANIREGVVITPAKERRDDTIGRVILKSVSEDYLLRKGATEFN